MFAILTHCSSDPSSSNYGKHMTAEEVHDFFAPAQESVDAVRSWLEKAGVEANRISQSVNKQWIQLDLSAWEAESLLQTKYHFFEHAPTGKSTIACDEYVTLHSVMSMTNESFKDITFMKM